MNSEAKSVRAKSKSEANQNAPEGMVFVHTHSVMDDCGTGGICGFYATPAQKKEYEEGMARMAEMG